MINVPAVTDENGRLMCVTTSTYSTNCPILNDPDPVYITGVNSNAESYFSPGPKSPSTVQISFSTPFLFAPLNDPFPAKVVNEYLGYVPQTLIEWMAQHSEYVSKYPGIASCLPGGPSVDFAYFFCPPGWDLLGALEAEHDLTFSSTVTVAGKGCFHPGACPTPAAPGDTPVAAIPAVTPEVHAENSMSSLCHL